jgi:hypothetical protein
MFSPLTPALSPLRGEGDAGRRVGVWERAIAFFSVFGLRISV